MFSIPFTTAFLLTLVSAHTQLFHINTPSKPNVNCVRNTNTYARDSPITEVTSSDMTCGAGPTTAAQEKCQVEAGQSLSLVWGHQKPDDDIIDPTHVGPCNVYLVPFKGGNVPTSGWFKISQGIWDPVNKWCTDKLIKNKGVLDVQVPASLKAGDYLLRSEINALHNANSPNGAQFYIFCSEIKVTGSGTSLPSAAETVSIPGWINAQTNGVMFNVYGQGDVHEVGGKYPQLGGPVASLAAGSAAATVFGNSSSSSSDYSAPLPVSSSSLPGSSGSSSSAQLPVSSGSYAPAASGGEYNSAAQGGYSSAASAGYGSGSVTSSSSASTSSSGYRKKCHRRLYRN